MVDGAFGGMTSVGIGSGSRSISGVGMTGVARLISAPGVSVALGRAFAFGGRGTHLMRRVCSICSSGVRPDAGAAPSICITQAFSLHSPLPYGGAGAGVGQSGCLHGAVIRGSLPDAPDAGPFAA